MHERIELWPVIVAFICLYLIIRYIMMLYDIEKIKKESQKTNQLLEEIKDKLK